MKKHLKIQEIKINLVHLTILSWPPVIRCPVGSINLQHVKVRSDKLANGSGFIHLKMTTLPEWTLLKVPLHSNTARWVSLKSMQKIGNKSCKKREENLLRFCWQTRLPEKIETIFRHKPCPFGSGLKKFALDFVCLRIFFF